jgi:pimeloyl-ACP methyl ester carboxylesterase
MGKNTFAAAVLALSVAICGGAFAEEPVRPWQTLRPTAPLSPPLKTGRQDVGEVELHYAVYGRGEPVILLHPGLGNGDYWANQVGPLSQEFQVIVVDLRDHGRSTASRGPLSYRLMAEDIVHLIKAQKLKKPAIVGWGDGATVGLELARRYPKRIGKLVAFGMAYDRAGLQPRPDEAATFVDYVMKAQADHARLSGDPASFTATLDKLEALWEREPAYTASDLTGIQVPVVLMAAQYDEWVKTDHMVEAARLIPEARIITLPRTSHFAPWQASRRFNDALRLILRPADG